MTGDTYFRPAPHATLRQGDIFVGPSARLWTRRSSEADPTTPPAKPEPGRSAFRPAWDEDSWLAPVVETRNGLVMVVSHGCEIEKEFNREVRRLMEEEGLEQSAAVQRASEDPGLDRLVVVAPLRAYEDFPERDRPGIRSGQRIGYLPTEELPGIGVEMVVDVTELTTVERQMLPPGRKVASLSDETAGELGYKLSEAYAIRGLSVIAELEAVVGRTIVAAEATEKSRKKTALVIRLDDGSLRNLEIRKPRDELPEEVTRATGDER